METSVGRSQSVSKLQKVREEKDEKETRNNNSSSDSFEHIVPVPSLSQWLVSGDMSDLHMILL